MNPLPPRENQESFEWEYPTPSVSATATWKVRKPTRRFVIDEIQYLNVTGLAGDATNAFTVDVLVGVNTIANLVNTDTDSVPPGAALAANAWITGTILKGASLDYNQGDANEEVTVVATKIGTQTLPAGLLIIKGRYLS